MTRGLVPPESLSKEDIQTLAEVRRDIYFSAVKGLGRFSNDKSLFLLMFDFPH